MNVIRNNGWFTEKRKCFSYKCFPSSRESRDEKKVNKLKKKSLLLREYGRNQRRKRHAGTKWASRPMHTHICIRDTRMIATYIVRCMYCWTPSRHHCFGGSCGTGLGWKVSLFVVFVIVGPWSTLIGVVIHGVDIGKCCFFQANMKFVWIQYRFGTKTVSPVNR